MILKMTQAVFLHIYPKGLRDPLEGIRPNNTQLGLPRILICFEPETVSF